MIVYGIKNCDTVKKALHWLDSKNIKYQFHDYKKLGVSEDKLKEWAAQLGWENLINKRGQTWRKLDSEVQKSVSSAEAAFRLMQEKTSVIKRPLIETPAGIVLGFDEPALENLTRQ